MSRGRFVVNLTRRQLEAVKALVSVTVDAGDAPGEDLQHLARALDELGRAAEDRLPRAVDWIDKLALELDFVIDAAGGDEVSHHPFLMKAARVANAGRRFVRSLNSSTHPKEGSQ